MPTFSVRFVRALVRAYLHVRFDLRLRGLANLPAGGCVIAPNHVSLYDPLLLSALLPRLPRHLAADELLGRGRRWRVPACARGTVAWALRVSRAIPVARQGRDVGAARAALRGLQAGDQMVVYMQGGIGGGGVIAGASWLAQRGAVPLVPVRISGLPGRGLRPRVTIDVLRPLEPGRGGETPAQLARRAWGAIEGGDGQAR